MKGQVQTSDGILGGKQVIFSIDLAKGPIEGNLIVDGLGFSKASIEVVCGSSIGIGGTAAIEQRNTLNGVGGALAIPATIAFTAGDRTSKYDITFSGRFLVIDVTGLTLTELGRITVIVVLKL